MCHACNHAKLAGFDEDGEGFIHPYYDLLPDLDFLIATVDLDGADPGRFLRDRPRRRRYQSASPTGSPLRMEALKLEARYQQEVNTYVASHAAALHLAHRAEGQAGVRRTLRLQARYEIHSVPSKPLAACPPARPLRT